MLFSTEMKDLAKIYPKAANFWAQHDMAALENGSYDLGDGECVNVMSYDTKPLKKNTKRTKNTLTFSALLLVRNIWKLRRCRILRSRRRLMLLMITRCTVTT